MGSMEDGVRYQYFYNLYLFCYLMHCKQFFEFWVKNITQFLKAGFLRENIDQELLLLYFYEN